jgi:hypothetical protein
MTKPSIVNDISPIQLIIQTQINMGLQSWDVPPEKFENEELYEKAKEKFRIRVVRKVFKDIGIDLKKSQSIYFDELSIREKELPYGWMTRDKDISIVLRKTHIVPVLNYFYRSCTMEMTRYLQTYIPYTQYMREVTTIKGNIENRELILFSVDYQKAGDELDLVESVIQRYLSRFTPIGIIEKLTDGRGKAKRPTIYAAGTWGLIHNSRYWFLKETNEWKAKLRTFKAFQ